MEGRLIMIRLTTRCLRMVLLALAILSIEPKIAGAASCCGGGSASSLVLPKFSRSMVDVSFDYEKYDGYWDREGVHLPDPPGADLAQYRLNLGYAKRFGDNLQASIVAPLVFNKSDYSGVSSDTNGLGDATLSFWYETFETVTCVFRVEELKDLKPAVYLGASLNVPTGLSPYDDVGDSFDITGRGFYRLDLSAIVEKTVYPWNVSLLFSYGIHLERSVNREYGVYVEPYQKSLGDRALATISGGYTHFLPSMKSLTGTVAYSDLWEGEGEVDGKADPATSIRKRSLSFTAALSSDDRDRIYKFTYNHAFRGDEWGENFPTTDIFTLGVTHVFR